jgi:hypothetical protein
MCMLLIVIQSEYKSSYFALFAYLACLHNLKKVMSSKPYSIEHLHCPAARCLLIFCMIFIFYVIGVQHGSPTCDLYDSYMRLLRITPIISRGVNEFQFSFLAFE